MRLTCRWLLLPLALLAGCCSTDPELLKSSEPEERREALACLADDVADDPSMKRRLEEAAMRLISSREEPYPAVRATAVRVLAHLETRSALDALSKLLAGEARDEDPVVRVACVDALVVLSHGDDAAGPLRSALRTDPAESVRLAAARELGDLRRAHVSEITDALIESLSDVSLDVRLLARDSLRRLHGTDQGTSRQSWLEWVDENRADSDLPAEEPFEPESEPELGSEPEPEPDLLLPEEEFPDEPMEPLDEGEPEPPASEEGAQGAEGE